MSELLAERPKRKILSVRLEPKQDGKKTPPRFVEEPQSIYMVWREGGGMPKRIYRDGERSIAESHAKKLAEQTGDRFWVMRAWRAYDPAS